MEWLLTQEPTIDSTLEQELERFPALELFIFYEMELPQQKKYQKRNRKIRLNQLLNFLLFNLNLYLK